jgi:cell division protease FtsH
MDPKPGEEDPSKPKIPPRPRPRLANHTLLFVFGMLGLLIVAMMISEPRNRSAISYGFFLEQLEARNIAEARINGLEVTGRFVTPPMSPVTMTARPVRVQPITYGRFLVELEKDNISEAHSDGREIVGRFKQPISIPAAAAPGTSSAAATPPSPTASATATGAASTATGTAGAATGTAGPALIAAASPTGTAPAAATPSASAGPTPTAGPAPTAAAPSSTATPADTPRDFRVLISSFGVAELDRRLVEKLGANYTFEQSLDRFLVVREPAKSEEKSQKLGEEFVVVLSPLADEHIDRLLRERLGENYRAERLTDSTGWMMTFYIIISLVLVGGMILMFRRSRDQMMGGGFLTGFSKSPAKRYDLEGNKRITFADVAGLESVKGDLVEVVEFLKSPQKFQRLGGRIPKGILLFGPPGTGKTLLAKAVAGEAGVPFFSINGSEFIQMFVGVGASRVRDMFRTAKEAAPCILFIDEIDAVGRVRGAGLGSGQDEREQTLNQILSEMDGFSPNESVIVLAATNRPDVLDPALLRPGRFDRHFTVDRPNLKGREQLFKVHTRDVPLAEDVDLKRLAAGTVGLTGADIRNLVNEAALWATRQDKSAVEMVDFEYARDKVLMGAKREEVLNDHEKEMTAYHEAGHALLAWILPGNDRVHKVTVIPRGRALGVTQLLPQEDRLNISESELHSRLVFIMGGRAAEKLVYDEYSAGAEDDLKRATQLARRMVAHWGMSKRLGPVAFRVSDENPFLGREMSEPREFSEHTAQVIDEETGRILNAAADRATELLTKHRDKLDKLTRKLVEREQLDEKEIEQILGPAADRSKIPDEVLP